MWPVCISTHLLLFQASWRPPDERRFRGTSPKRVCALLRVEDTLARRQMAKKASRVHGMLMKDAAPAHLKCQAAFSAISLMGSESANSR